MRRKKLFYVIVGILVTWFIVFMVDIASTLWFGGPIFMRPLFGGGIIIYQGLGYRIDVFVPLLPAGMYLSRRSAINIHPLPYILINSSIIVTFLAYRLIKKRTK